MPEGIYPIVEATLYLATAPKSNSAGAYFKAVNKVEEEDKVAVPDISQDEIISIKPRPGRRAESE